MSKAKIDIFKKALTECDWDNIPENDKPDVLRKLLMVGFEEERKEMIKNLNEAIKNLTNVSGLLSVNKAPLQEDWVKVMEPFHKFTQLCFETINARQMSLNMSK